jgi:hypothetical protein
LKIQPRRRGWRPSFWREKPFENSTSHFPAKGRFDSLFLDLFAANRASVAFF